jgi:dTDP-4-dehydrorhamnose 3,5-epimerase
MDKIEIIPTKIAGLEIVPVKVFENEKGKLLHVLRCDSSFFEKFGEAYMSVTYPGVIKGWKYHKTLRQNFVVPAGTVKFVFYDDRIDSLTKGNIVEIETGESNYFLLKIPAQLWYSFKTISQTSSIILNCATEPHDPTESINLELSMANNIPYHWN